MSAMSRLIAAWKTPWVLGFSLFGLGYGGYTIIDMTQSGKAYNLEADLTGKTYIVTGASSGIGQVTAQELAKRNARVIMACRNREKCIEIRRDIVLNTRNKQVFCRQCDLQDFDSIVSFVAKLSEGKFAVDRVDGVLHNAATMNATRLVNKEGIESTMATNHFGTFLLTGLLHDKLSAQDHHVRLVYLNSNVITRNTNLNFENLNEEVLENSNKDELTEEEKKSRPKKFDHYEVYKRSKLAEAVFVKELAEKLKSSNISVLMTDPGRTNTFLTSAIDGERWFLSRWMIKATSMLMGERRPEKAVRPVLYALCEPDVDSGVFVDRERNEQPWPEAAMNVEKRRLLWVTSEKWTRFAERLASMKALMNPQEGGAPEQEPAHADDTNRNIVSRFIRRFLW